MSNADKLLLTSIDLSLTQLATLMGVSRQAVTKQVSRTRDYLDADRVERVLTQLSRERATDTAYERAYRLLAPIAANKFHVELPSESAQPKRGTSESALSAKEFWIFSEEPLEIAYADYLERMQEKYFADEDRLMVYFVSTRDAAKDLSKRLQAAKNTMDKPFKAAVFVIHTNMVLGMPHTVVLDPGSICAHIESRGNDPVAMTLTAIKDDFVETSVATAKSILRVIRRVGLGQISRDSKLFFPADRAAVLTDPDDQLFFRHEWNSFDSDPQSIQPY
jgi:hypothetical protein